MSYTALHDAATGRFTGVALDGRLAFIPPDPGNRDWVAFLAWNETADPPVSTADLPPPTAEQVVAARRAAAGTVLLAGATPEQTAIRAADVALWTFGRNDVAEYCRAVLEIVCDNLNVAYPSPAEIAVKIATLRGGYDPGVTPETVADRGGRRLTDAEIVLLLQAVLSSGAGDPRA